MTNYFQQAGTENPHAATVAVPETGAQEILASSYPAPEPQDDEEFLSDDFVAENKLGKFTIVLMALIVLGVGAIGGIYLNKSFGGATGGASAMSGAPSGMTGGMSGMSASGSTSGSTSGTGQGGFGQSQTAAATGEITAVKSSSIVISTDDGSVTVTVSDDTVVSTSGTAGLAKGVTVSVYGETGDDGTVTATSIVQDGVSVMGGGMGGGGMPGSGSSSS